ncbi:MAG: hypothetical protein MUF72_09215 [Elainella sp. Prado103]|nr:hypothetical protein [Elainella sp. Prado103]
MQISRPNCSEPSPEELLDLQKLKVTIERAISDGKLTPEEMRQIKTLVWADGKISPQELNLISHLVTQKLQEGELEWVW